MSAFDIVIGYESIKAELTQISDMIRNRKVYAAFGAKLPQGILLHGEPGLGKTLMAKCFIEACGLESYVIRRNRGNDDFIGLITDTFLKAKENTPAIIFLDDMDKFSNEDSRHPDTPEYVAVQAGIDDVKGCDVFVVATANDIWKFPDSLIRTGRFDKIIEIRRPTNEDAAAIIEYYLSNMKVGPSVVTEDLTKMISYSSCAELETVLNEAAINAVHAEHNAVEMEDLIKAVLRRNYDSPDDFTKTSEEDLQKTAIHEAGHLVVSEALNPGSVGLASLKADGRDSCWGFIHRCLDLKKKEHQVLISLGGKAAVELYYSDYCTEGCRDDLHKAVTRIREFMSGNASGGFGTLRVDRVQDDLSENLNARQEIAIQSELEHFMKETRAILLKNRALLEAAAAALVEKKTLLYSDIRELREKYSVQAMTA